MNEAEYRMKYYGDRGRMRRITPSEISIINTSHDTKAEYNNCFIIHSK